MRTNVNHTVALLAVIFTAHLSVQSIADGLVQIRLVDPLDEPEFYCLDVSGWAEHLKLDDPLQAHTCKVSDGYDQMFFVRDESILVGDTGRCLEIAGTGMPLPGAAIIARACSGGSMQAFKLNEDGRISATGSDLCLAVGDRSAAASGPSHVWRVLTVELCDAVNPKSVIWQIGL